MGKVNWINERIRYCADENATYDLIAKTYHVAKSTITRRAARERWPQLRQEYQAARHKNLTKANINKQNEVEEKHLKTIRMAITAANNTIVGVANKVAAGTQTPEDMRQLNAATSALYKSILLERVILRLPTKPVILNNQPDIDEYKVMMGLKEPPLNQGYRNLKEASLSFERMIERQKMIDGMIEETNRQGAY